MTFVASGEHALHDHLIGAPVPDAEDWGSKKDARPGELGIADGFDHVEISGRHIGTQSGKSSHAVQANKGERDGAGQQNQSLHDFGVDHGRQPARDGVDTGHDHEHDGCFQRTPADYSFQHDGGSPQVD